jgi:branched-chain amino acid transport system permease protein
MLSALRRNRPLLVTLVIVLVVLLLMARRFEPKVTASVLLSGLTLGSLYFLVASGLSLIFGLMDVLNFAQGGIFMIGAYLGFTTYANPRLILNVLPFALAILGGVQVGRWLGGLLPARFKKRWLDTLFLILLFLLSLVLLLIGFRGFDLGALAAATATATGGAVATELAQDPASVYLPRVALLTAAGLLLGIGLSRVGKVQMRQRTRGTTAIVGLVLVAVAFALVPFRTPAEIFLLSVSSNVRFVLALLVGLLAGGGLGALIEVSVIRPLYGRPLYQILLTLGLGYVLTELVKSVWGTAGYYMDTPEFFNARGDRCPSPNLWSWFSDHCQSISVLGRPFPSYRLFIIALGLTMFIAIALLLKRTRLGIIIRAGVQDSEMVQALGINVRRVFTLVFAIGCALAAVGGVAAAPFLGVNLGLGAEIQLQAFIAVVIGGMGSFVGAAVGALLVGMARAFGDQLVLSGIRLPWMDEAVRMSPSIARASTVLIMALVLLIRPTGLFGKKE